MEDKNKDMGKEIASEQALEEKETEDARELSDKQLDDIAGGSSPTIKPW
jgi:hypothetical protein